MESRKGWILEDEKRGFKERDSGEGRLFVNSGMLRVQPSEELSALEKETLANMERDGLRHTQFVKSDPVDRQRAQDTGWLVKLLEFDIPNSSPKVLYESVLDSTAGFLRCSRACAYYQKVAAAKGVQFYFGPESGAVKALNKENSQATGV